MTILKNIQKKNKGAPNKIKVKLRKKKKLRKTEQRLGIDTRYSYSER